MNLFQLIGRYFWLVCLVVSACNYVTGTRRAKQFNDPDANNTAMSIRRWFGVASALPWIVMGFGEMVGGVPSVWHYFRPQDGNPYVLAWFGSLFFVAMLFACWVFFFGGGEKFVKFQPFEIIRRKGISLTVGRVKFFAALGPLWYVLCAYLVASMDVQIPK